MFDMIINIIGMALFIGIYAYALSTEPLLGGHVGLWPGLRLWAPVRRAPVFNRA